MTIGSIGPNQPLVVVFHADRADGVGSRIDAGHGGREYGGQDEACQAAPHFVQDKVGKGPVRAPDPHGQVRVQLVVGVKGQPQAEGQQGDRDRQEGLEPHRPPGVAQGAAGEVALHADLIGHVGEARHHACGQGHPDGEAGCGIQAEVEHPQLVVADDHAQDLGRRVLPEDQGDRCSQAEGEEEKLQDVGPDNGLHAAHQGVGGGHRRGQEDGDRGLDSGELLDGQGDGHHDGGHPGQAGGHEDRAGQEPGGIVEPPFQVLVDGGHLQSIEEVQEEIDRDGYGQKAADAEQQILQIVAIGLTRASQVADGRQQAGQLGDADRHPAHGSSRQQVVCRASLLARKSEADRQHHQRVGNDQPVVHPLELDLGEGSQKGDLLERLSPDRRSGKAGTALYTLSRRFSH